MKTVHLFACSVAFASMLGAQTGGLSSVEGQVISSADGAPVRRAVVVLMRSTGRATLPGQPPQTPISQLQAQTDDQGHFTFRDLDAGGYRVTVQRQGFVGQNGMPGPPAPNSELWLGEGQQLTGYVYRATPQSVIAGKVLDENGDPVMGAQVYAQRAGSANGGRPQMAGSVQTNDLGEFRIANLSAGDYIVAANYQDRSRMIYAGNQQPASDKPQLVYATTYHPATAVASEAAPVHVPDGGGVISGVDIKLAKIDGYSIRVTVVDPGAPANGALDFPNLRPRDPAVTPFGGNFGGMRQQDGTFLFQGVPPGSYIMTAQRNNAGIPGSAGLSVPVAAASANMPIEVRDRNLEGVVLQMKPNADLQGVVRFDPQGGCNAGNLSIRLSPPGQIGGPIYGPMPQPAQVGDDLRFTLKGVAPGAYSVNLNGAGNRCYVKSMLYGGEAVPGGVLTVGDSGSLEIVLGSYSAQLSVTAVDGSGNPAPGARITAVPKEGNSVVSGGMNSITSRTGQVTMGSLRPGTYDVYAFENPGQNAPLNPLFGDALRPYEGRGKTVSVGETGRSSVEVTVIPASETGAAAPPTGAKGSLAGKVVNAVSGSALAGVVVTLRGQSNMTGPSRAPSVTTDDQGRFAFPGLAPGQYALSAVEQRFIEGVPGPMPNLASQVVVGEGQQVSAYVLKLLPAGVIAGTLKDESGEPVLGARVQAFRYRDQAGERRLVAAGTTQTDDLGKYRIASLAPGDYYVAVERVTAAVAPAVTMVRSDTFVDDPEIELARQATEPRTANSQTPDSITGPLPSEPETDYAGMWYPNAAQFSAAAAVKVAAGATVDNIDMTWRRTRVQRIRGQVVDAAGSAVAAPTLRLMPKGVQAMLLAVGSQRSARDGSFEITGVPAGSYNLMAWPGPVGGRGGQVNGAMAVNGPGGSSTRMAVQSIEVKDSSIEGIKLELSGGRTIKGSIKMEGGGPVPRPGFFSLRSQEAAAAGMMTMGSGDGTFTINNGFPLVYTLNYQNLPANCYVKSIRFGGKDVPLTGFELTGDGQLEVLISNTAAILEGSISGADGKPAGLAGVVVTAVSGPEPVRMGNADAAGNFYFANLPPGDYRVLAWDGSAPEASDPPESLAPFARYAKTVTLGASAHEKLQVTVVPAGR